MMKSVARLVALLLPVPAVVAAAGPPEPVPYRRIPDPPDDAERHIAVKAADRGPVWLLTGFLGQWYPQIDYNVIARVKPRHWRQGLWPFWHPRSLALGDDVKEWGDMRDSPVILGKYLDTMLRLRKTGMTWQVILHHKGPYYGVWTIKGDGLKGYYDHIYTLVKYCRHMGLPVDYWEVINEPPTSKNTAGNPGGYAFKGTWEEFLAFWDTNYDAIRAADPKAKIVGPSFGGSDAAEMEPFLAHCREKGQKLDVLSWHINCIRKGPNGEYWEDYDYVHRNINEMRALVEAKFPKLGIREYHVDEWSYYIPYAGTGSQIAHFYYMDLAGLDRAAKTQPPRYLNGILLSPRTPRAAYWAWVEYAKQDGGLRLATETDDHNLVVLASRHDKAKVVRALVARARKMAAADPPESAPNWKWGDHVPAKPPVTARIDFEGLPLSGQAEVTILRLPPGYGPLYEDELDGLTTTKTMAVRAGKLTVALQDVVEDNVFSMVIGPKGTREKEKADAARWATTRPDRGAKRSERQLHRTATRKARQAAAAGHIRIACGAALAWIDPAGNGWFADREYREGGFGNIGGGGVHRGKIKISGTDNPELYRTELWGQSAYRITVPNGTYLVRLHFAETYGSNRKFDVTIEGRTVLKEFNPLGEAGGRNIAVVREFTASVTDGVLDIGFVQAEGAPPAMINGIEVIRK